MAEAKKRRGKNAKVTTPEDTVPRGIEITDAMKNKWIFGTKIGSGGCGDVYEGAAASTPTSYDYVIKIEHHENGPLFTEIHVYHKIGKAESINQFIKLKKLNFLGIPVCHSTGSFMYNDRKYRFLVLRKYGRDLQYILDLNNNRLNPKTVFTVGIIVMDALEYIHTFGYVHGDVKAGNLLLGPTKNTANQVYLLDMGLATLYESRTGEHKSDKPNPSKANNGTPEFLSRDGHTGVFSRRSDLEILGYNMLLWLCGTLPWIKDIKSPTKLKAEKDRYMKDVPSLMRSLFPNSSYPELQKFLEYINGLGFVEKPNYEYCTALFKKSLKTLGFKDDGVLILTESRKKSGMDEASVSESSQKENNAKKAEKKRRVNSKEASTSIALAPGEVLTPAMLAVLNRQQEKAAEKPTKRPRKKAGL